MRLLKTKDSDRQGWLPQLVDARGYEEYAILSHRWENDANDEVVFADIETLDDGGIDRETGLQRNRLIYNPGYAGRSPIDKPGYSKVKGAAMQALRDGKQYLWVDTCCIDKSSSAELSEAINSMWNWYQRSAVCYVYLVDVHDIGNKADVTMQSLIAQSVWWKRGWTLQELIAPKASVFFTRDWTPVTECDLSVDTIAEFSGIPSSILSRKQPVISASIAQRMSWASHRTTTRSEDLAYCLMGLFDVNMPLLYGEGEKAFIRLQQEIMKDSNDESIFAWRDPVSDPKSMSGLLARHPSFFAESSSVISYTANIQGEPYILTNRGLSMTLTLTPTTSNSTDRFLAALNCPSLATGDGYLAIHLLRIQGDEYTRIRCAELGILHKRGSSKTVFIRQKPLTEYRRVLPYHYFNLRNVYVHSKHGFCHLRQARYCEQYEPTVDNKRPPPCYRTTGQREWNSRSFNTVFRVDREPGKVSAGLHFALDYPASTRTCATSFTVVLGSISHHEIGFDAYENSLDLTMCRSIHHLEKKFDPRPAQAGIWIDLGTVSVNVSIRESHANQSIQEFITDITIKQSGNTTLPISGTTVVEPEAMRGTIKNTLSILKETASKKSFWRTPKSQA